jgi:aminoglycoside/choline kinase family phosphotransferase
MQRTDLKNRFISKNITDSEFTLKKLPADASFREYYRISYGENTVMLMDSSKELDSLKSFINVSNILSKKGLSVPKIIAEDTEKGFLLLEDFGDYTYTKLLSDRQGQESEIELYKKAIDVLVELHKDKPSDALPQYCNKTLMKELLLMVDWYFPTLNNAPLSKELRNEYINIWENILPKIRYKDSCMVLRDYHVDNIMMLPNRHGVREVGLLDFQDALIGSYSYDFISLLEDARKDIPEDLYSEMLHYYFSKSNTIDKQKFLNDITILGMQRSLKIIGIFTRKASRDNNTKYLVCLPRLWKYIAKHLKNPIFEPLQEWFKKVEINIGI